MTSSLIPRLLLPCYLALSIVPWSIAQQHDPHIAERVVVSDDLATLNLKLGKRTYRAGESVEVTVTLIAGKNGVYLPNYFEDWISTCINGFSADILTEQGKHAGEPFGCGRSDSFGPGSGVTAESEFHKFIYLQPGETRVWKKAIQTAGIQAGAYTVVADYVSYSRLIQEVAKLPQAHGVVAIGHIMAKPIDIRISN